MNEKVDIKIGRRRLTVEMEGLTPLEISRLAQLVSDKLAEMEAQNDKVVDTSILALLASLHFANDLESLRQKQSIEQAALERKIEELSIMLRASLTHAEKK